MSQSIEMPMQPFNENTATITLYFDLEEGKKADLETVARTAIAFSELIKRLASHIDFGSEIRIELESGTEGSLGLNAIVKWVKGFSDRHPVLTTIIVSSLISLSEDVRAWTVGEILSFLNGKDAPPIAQTLSDEQRKQIATDIARHVSIEIFKEERQRIFLEAQNDPAIKGLGGTGIPGKRPEIIISRSEFLSIIEDNEDIEEDVKFRNRKETMKVILIRPRLKAEFASWRFQYGSLPEFSAEMKDRDFLDAMAGNRVNLPLKVGTEMEIMFEIEEKFENNTWTPTKRSAIKVISPTVTPLPSLFDNP